MAMSGLVTMVKAEDLELGFVPGNIKKHIPPLLTPSEAASYKALDNEFRRQDLLNFQYKEFYKETAKKEKRTKS